MQHILLDYFIYKLWRIARNLTVWSCEDQSKRKTIKVSFYKHLPRWAKNEGPKDHPAVKKCLQDLADEGR